MTKKKMNRRTFGKLGAALAGASIAPRSWAMGQKPLQAQPLEGAALFDDVKHYVNLGIHHTGLGADRATSAWQAEHLSALGYQVSLSDVPVRQYVSSRADLMVGDEALSVWPQWPQAVASCDISGRVVDWTAGAIDAPASGAFVMVRISGNTIDTKKNLAAINPALDAGAAAVIAVCSHESGRYQIGNVHETLAPFKAPVVLAGSADLDKLRAQTTARLVLEGSFQNAIGQSVTGKIDRGRKWLIVSTPQSGWTHCGAERGPGIAVFRALAAHYAGQADGPSLCFTSNTGHEFHNLGARILHDQDALPHSDETALWLHLGAGFASRAWQIDESYTYHFSDAHNRALVMATPKVVEAAKAQRADGLNVMVQSTEQFNIGEMLDVTANGYDPALGVVGYASHHHVPGDDETTTSAALLQGMGRYMAAMADMVLSRTRGDYL